MAEILQFRRPAPEVVKAKLAEIAKRYRRRARHASKAQFAAIRLGELNRLYKARHGEQVPDNAAGRDLVLIAAHHIIRLAGHPKGKLMAWASMRAPWMTVAEIDATLAETASRPVTWKADTLAKRLNLAMAERQALRIGTIGAIDCSRAERQVRRKSAAKARAQASRERRKVKVACAP